MPSSQEITRPDPALAVAEQYLRRERLLSTLMVILVLSTLFGTFLVASLLPAVIVGAVLLVAIRVPLIQPDGTASLRTDDDVETVIESFTGPVPPVLVFQWGIADEIISKESTVTYRISYLFGLRSTEITVHSRTITTQNRESQVELEVTANEQPWSTYTVTIHQQSDQTAITYDYTADRRFGVRRVPQRIIAKRYRNKALSEQGYTVVERPEDDNGI
ncbi:MAG: hypothetical protein J07HQX50_01532 [Haloquadratum sp. J07HQX50]|nr:MAG: hypothetical protein J07HQX50_01532 [Haloquadratum sp. J07HQX50]